MAPSPLRPWLLRSLLLASWLLAAGALGAQSEPSRRSELEEIRGQIVHLEARLQEVREHEQGLGGRLESVKVELELQRQRVAEAVAAREVATREAAEAEAEVVRLEGVVSEARQVLRRRLGSLYQLGRHSYLRLVMSVNPGSDLLRAVRLLRYLVRRDAEVVGRYLEVRDRLRDEQTRLVAQRLEAERWAAEELERRDRLVAVQRRQERLLARVTEERLSLSSQAAELAEKERRLEDLIATLAGGLEDLAGRPIQDFHGVLDWPLSGEVLAGFGPRMDPRYGTRVPHNGIEIASVPGAAAAVVYPGKVMFAAPLQGYGPTVVVLHPGRVFTLYAGLADLRVSPEDVLSLGDVVGSTSDRVYFEIRVDNRPQDPLGWLR